MPLEVFDITGTISKIHWQNLYATGTNHIITVKTDNDEEYKIYGMFPLLREGQRITCKVHRDYDGKLISDTFNFVVEYNVYMLYRLLTAIKGIGNKTAKDIVDKLSQYRLSHNMPLEANSLENFVSDIEQLNIDNKTKTFVCIELRKFAFAEELYKIFGNSMSYKDILSMTDALIQSGKYVEFYNNPYILVDVYQRVNMRALDQYMLNVYNIDPTAKSRLLAYTKYVIYDLGFTHKVGLIDENTLASRVLKYSNSRKVKPLHIKSAIDKLKEDGFLAQTNTNMLLLRDVYDKAVSVADKLKMRLDRDTKKINLLMVENMINKYESVNGLKLSPEQRQAVLSVFSNDIVLIGGSAGTGKSTVTNLIFEIGRALGLDVKILTPTGKAASRYSPEVGAQTIHFAIGWNGFQSNKSIAADMFIIDEASMVDLDILFEFLNACNDESKIIFVGDHYQLPPVGFGAPFEELIASKLFPYVELTTVYRQEGGLLDFIHAIRTYNRPKIANIVNGKLLRKDDSIKDLLITVLDKDNLTDYLIEAAKRLKNDFTVLMPIKNPYISSLNVTRINELIVKELKNLGVKDTKVICVENDYERNVFNGDSGLLKYQTINNGVTLYNIEFFGNMYEYTELEKLRFIEPGYALTVHKSQGSEYDIVFVLLFSEHVKYFDKKMLYTAVSRAKKKLVILSDMQIMNTIDTIMQRRNTSFMTQFGILYQVLTNNLGILEFSTNETNVFGTLKFVED